MSQAGHHRTSISSNPTHGDGVTSHSNPRSPSFSSAVAAARYEEAQLQRAELEAVKRENESLRQRVRELERSLAGANPTRASVGST